MLLRSLQFALLFFSLTLFSESVFAQKPTLHWKKAVGGDREDVFRSLTTTYDGYIVAAGHSNSKGKGNNDGYLAVFDEFGSVVLDAVLGGDRDDEIYSIVKTFDGHFVVAGVTRSYESRKGNG